MTSERHIFKTATLYLFLCLLHDTNSSFVNGNSTLRIKRQNRAHSTVPLDRCRFRCNDGQCISGYVTDKIMCNGLAECKDGSDETKELCSKIPCPSYRFRCGYGACIYKDNVCDGEKDCVDGSDEKDTAGCKTIGTSGQSEFQCKNGECINDFNICDGVPTCKDGSDETEETCGKTTCLPFTYRCAYGACVDRGARCNGRRECADGSDEAGCRPVDGGEPVTPTTTTTTPPVVPSCLLPQHPPNGKFSFVGVNNTYNPNTPTPSSSSIMLTCDPGYQKDTGARGLFCISGTWQGGELSEQRCLKLCSSPTVDESVTATCTRNNAQVNCDEAVEGTRATTKCADFFKDHYNGWRPIQTCTNGRWTPEVGPCTPACGLKRVNAQTLVIGGSPTYVEEYPWVVAIYNDSNVHICGATIISRRFVLSAAHCFADHNGVPYEVTRFTIIAGKYYRAIDHSEDANRQQIRKVRKLYVHDAYRGSLRNYQYDIAVVELDQDLQLTPTVQTVCMGLSDDTDLIEGNLGVVSGWGFTEEGGAPAEELKKLVIPYHNTPICKEKLPSDFHDRYLTPDKFCAGYFEKKTSVCSGDSGGGYYMNSSNIFYIRGIVSLAPTSAVGCDSNNFALFSKISFFFNWIYGITQGFV